MSDALPETARRAAAAWRPPPPLRWIRRPAARRAAAFGAVVYLAVALVSLEVNWGRLQEGLPRALRFVAAFATPDFLSHGEDILQGFLESLAMTVVATAAGVALAVPVAFGAARNVSVRPVYLLCRALLTLLRGFQEIILAILFVVMVGFGPLAGVLTLVCATVGFLAKLLAEDIEEVARPPVEAVRATGASWLQIMRYGVLPQILPRLTGLSVYRLDINFRESAVIGVVGAGGIGATLNTAFDRYEFDTAAAILIVIVAIVLAGEIASGRLRRRAA